MLLVPRHYLALHALHTLLFTGSQLQRDGALKRDHEGLASLPLDVRPTSRPTCQCLNGCHYSKLETLSASITMPQAAFRDKKAMQAQGRAIVEGRKRRDFSEVFSLQPMTRDLPEAPQPPLMLRPLYSYQRRSLARMLEIEADGDLSCLALCRAHYSHRVTLG